MDRTTVLFRQGGRGAYDGCHCSFAPAVAAEFQGGCRGMLHSMWHRVWVLGVVFPLLACGTQSSSPSDDAGTSGPPPWIQLTGDRLAPLPPQGVGSSTHFV